ncbi:MAG: phosphatidylserine decarboxylase [Acidobacteria bacterium]|nr:phosphatidylserine decarboxylase [Acidobacteriota bacterium]
MIRDAYKFILPSLALGILFVAAGFAYIGCLFFILALFVAFFFRNPSRNIPEGKNLIVSPADGKIVKISKSDSGEQSISIFLSIFDVHVNRSPIGGELKELQYKRGRFKAAFYEEASRVNEQNILIVDGGDIQVTFKQIAGVIARRVVCWKKPGDMLEKGERVGLIRFGSRVDVDLPKKVNITVKIGDRVRGGSSVLGDYS